MRHSVVTAQQACSTEMVNLQIKLQDEASFNKFLCPESDDDPDHLIGGPSHWYNTSGVNKSSQTE